MSRGSVHKTATILQPFEIETYLSAKTSNCFDELIDMQQGTCFHRKKSEPKQFGAPYDKDEKILNTLIRSLNILDQRILLQKLRKESHTLGIICITWLHCFTDWVKMRKIRLNQTTILLACWYFEGIYFRRTWEIYLFWRLTFKLWKPVSWTRLTQPENKRINSWLLGWKDFRKRHASPSYCFLGSPKPHRLTISSFDFDYVCSRALEGIVWITTRIV